MTTAMQIEVKKTDAVANRLGYVEAAGVDVYPILETDDLCWVKVRLQPGAALNFAGRDAVKLLYRVSGEGTVRTDAHQAILGERERLVIPEGHTTALHADRNLPTEDIMLMGMNQIAGALFNTFRGSGE